MKVISGLGNPGEGYRFTRHNVGFRVVDLLADRWGHTGEGRVRDGAAVLEVTRPEPVGKVLLVKPLRYMNRSGGPLRAALRQLDAELASDLLVVADDIDLPLGRIRLRRSGSAGGHNGLRDIIATFKPDEREVANEMIALGADAAERWLTVGIEDAMNAFNGAELDGP